jgi:Domain of unknown function (DUF4365)
MGKSDYVGGRCKSIASMRLDRIWRTDADLPHFWPHFLGEKKKTFDFLVELVDAGPSTPFFFVQVKTTQKDYTKTQSPPRLRVEIDRRTFAKWLPSRPRPMSLVSMNAKNEPSSRSTRA